MADENRNSLRVAGGAAVVVGGAFVGFRFAFEQGAEVNPAIWTGVAYACLLVLFAALAIGALATGRYFWEELRGWETRVDFVAENGPGIAQIRVRNRGRTDSLVATATVLNVQEQVGNPRFLRSFNLAWMGHSGPRAELSRGSLDTLQIATSGRVEGSGRPIDRELLELQLWGWEGGELKPKDWFRWNGGDADAVVITVEVEVYAQRSARPARGVFVVRNIPFGGVNIQKDTSRSDQVDH